jgi:hypothetical protein
MAEKIWVFAQNSQILTFGITFAFYPCAMIGTGHLLIGGAVGVGAALVLPSPLAGPAALGLGIVSHHILDLVPHTDAATFYSDPRKPIPWLICALVALEIVLGLALTGVLYLSQHTTIAFVLGAGGGILPDLLDEVPLWQERFRRTSFGAAWHRWHTRLHCASMERAKVTGIVIDVCVIAAGLWLLL